MFHSATLFILLKRKSVYCLFIMNATFKAIVQALSDDSAMGIAIDAPRAP